MNEIKMIPIGDLMHHPENPRKDLGDLEELTASIKENGILQNLTVVPDLEKCKYLVVIGNRRFEAAKAAGLVELPCVISDMDHRQQIATMLEENMQRSDLTLYEQAQGFQMMMDLGYTQKEISEKTGFSETTVNRRLKMAELDKKTFQQAVGFQITMDDLDKLGQIKDIKKRNELLGKYGESNFDWMVHAEIKREKAGKVKPKAMKMIEDAKIRPIPDKDKYSMYGKYESKTGWRIELDKWDGKSSIIPETDGDLYYRENGTDIEFYVKIKKQKAEPVRKTQTEIEREQKIDLAWKIADRVTQMSHELRTEYASGLTVKPSNAMQMCRWAIIAAASDLMRHNYWTSERLKKNFDITGTYIEEQIDDLQKKITAMNQSEWPVLIQVLFEGLPEKPEETERFTNGYRKDFPKHQRNTRLEQCYAWLTEFGYQMSDEEIRMMAGTHECFKGGGK